MTTEADAMTEPEVLPGADDPRRRPRIGRPRGWTAVALVIALCFLAWALGWNLGRGRPPARDSADVGFLYDMVAHHTQAVEMARVELLEGEEPSVKVFAEEILRFQSYEIGVMDRMLDEWGYDLENPPDSAMAWMGHATTAEDMPGMATDDELEALREGDTDAVFLALMADHHAGGVAMAEAGVREVDDAEVRALAERIASSQRFEIRELIAAATSAGLDRSPAGVDIEFYDPLTGSLRDQQHGDGEH